MEHQKNFDRKPADEFVEKLVKLNRTAKTVKGGRRMSFSALTVASNDASFSFPAALSMCLFLMAPPVTHLWSWKDIQG